MIRGRISPDRTVAKRSYALPWQWFPYNFPLTCRYKGRNCRIAVTKLSTREILICFKAHIKKKAFQFAVSYHIQGATYGRFNLMGNKVCLKTKSQSTQESRRCARGEDL